MLHGRLLPISAGPPYELDLIAKIADKLGTLALGPTRHLDSRSKR